MPLPSLFALLINFYFFLFVNQSKPIINWKISLEAFYSPHFAAKHNDDGDGDGDDDDDDNNDKDRKQVLFSGTVPRNLY